MPYITKGGRYSGSWMERSWENQSRPYTKPMPITSRGAVLSAPFGRYFDWNPYPAAIDIQNMVPLANGYNQWGNGTVTASNKALDKLYDRLGQVESLRVAWLERQKALDLVTSNVRRLVTIARAVRRRDPRIIRRVLKRNPKAKDVIKTPAGLWLEYHFAIVPTISDIHDLFSIFSKEIETTVSVVGRSINPYDTAPILPRSDYHWYRGTQINYVKLGGRITGFDPNVSLASRLGFGQPLSVAYEMLPFSWFLDYFVNVGSMIKNLEPRFPGLQISDTYTSTFCKNHGAYSNYYRDDPENKEFSGFHYDSFYFNRKRGWPSYQLEFSSPLDLKAQQCSYIVAVLSSILVDIKRKS